MEQNFKKHDSTKQLFAELLKDETYLFHLQTQSVQSCKHIHPYIY